MASPSELNLDYKPNAYPLIQKPLGDPPEQTHELEDFLARLEVEKLKVEAFKRELPLCMQLLNNAMETYRRQLETYQSNNQDAKPVIEEFIPITNMCINGSEKPSAGHNEKVNWMISAQLWSRSSDHQTKQQARNTKLELDAKQRNGGGAFLPFSKEKINRKVPDLGLSSGEKEIIVEKKSLEINSDGVVTKSVISHEQQGKGGSHNNTTNEGQGGGGGHRKARRCWSPELHRRFVNALQMLGGSQVATPKQIRELMKVDGLTNDEVKSHLQKYRLHTRRPIQPPQPAPTGAPQLVVLGGIWVPPEYANSAAAATASNTIGPAIYGGPTHYSLPHNFYTSSQPLPHHHHILHHAPTVPYKACAQSPDSGLRSGGDFSESIEEGGEGEEQGAEEEEEEEKEGEEIMGDDKVKMNANDHDDDGGRKSLIPTENNGLMTLA